MTKDAPDQATVERRLWNEIQRHQTGMLGLSAGGGHFQPMTAFAEPETGEIWFFTRNDTDLVHEIGASAPAMFVFQQRDIQACIGGKLSLAHDRARIDKYWNAVVAAWYPEGKDDPHLTLLRLDCDDAQVWSTDAGPLKFAWEIVRANATKREPDVGDSTSLNFH